MPPDTSKAFYRTLYRLVITVCLVLTSFGCTRTAEKFCTVDQKTLKQNLIRLVQSPLIKDDDWVNATSITIDSVEPLPLSNDKADVSLGLAGNGLSVFASDTFAVAYLCLR